MDVRSHVPALLGILGSKVALHAARLSARKFGMDLTEWRVVQILGSEGRSSILNVAKLMSKDPGGVSRSVARLEDRGFISRQGDVSDRRKSFVDLTEDGAAFYEKISRFALEREERLLRHLAPAERSELRRLLKTLIDEADRMLEEGQANRPV